MNNDIILNKNKKEENSLAKKKHVDKHYSLIDSKYKLNSVELKIILTTISLIRKDDIEFKKYIIPIKEFNFLIKNNHYSRLKDYCLNLMKKPLEIKKDNGNWTIFNWFSSIEYNIETKNLELKISDDLKPYLLQLKSNFKSYNLEYIMPMKSEYSIRIYEILKKSEKLKTITYKLKELYDFLQVSNTFTSYGDFKRKILFTSSKEIALYTDIYYEYEEIKNGRKVESIKFKIFKNNYNKDLNLSEKEIFLSWVEKIRKHYINEELIYYPYKDANIRVNKKGMLYLDNGEAILPDDAIKLWEWMYKNKSKLNIKS